MANGFDRVQEEIREQRYSEHMSRAEATSPAVHQFRDRKHRINERMRRDAMWLCSPDAAAELGKYRGHYVYVAEGRVVAHGKAMASACRRAVASGFEPAEMLEVIVPLRHQNI